MFSSDLLSKLSNFIEENAADGCESQKMNLISLASSQLALTKQQEWWKERDEFGQTLIELAAEKGSTRIFTFFLNLLIELKVDILKMRDESGSTILHYACLNDNENSEIISLLISLFPQLQSIPDNSGALPIHWICKNGKTQFLRYFGNHLLNQGDSNEWTSLHYAAGNNHLELAQSLLSLGARSDIKDKFGRTPKDIALEKDYVDITHLLS